MPEALGITLGIILLLVFLFSGMPIFVAIGLGGAIGTMFFVEPGTVLETGHRLWESLWKYTLVAGFGFILMGNLFFENGFGNDIFDTAYKWLGRIRGGLLVAATAMGALYGFICGSATAGTATVGSITIPEIERKGYDMKVSLGAVAIAGTISVLIPPSLLMIIYAVLADVSLAQLFFAGIFPGFLLAGLIIVYVLIRAILNKNLFPAAPPASWRERLISLKGTVSVIVSFVVVLGGIYAGIWSVIEAAAAGAIMAVVCAMAYRRFTWAKFMSALNSTVRVNGMVLIIIISASFLNYFVFVSKLDEALAAFVNGLDLPSWAVMAAILLIMSAMGFIFDLFALIMVTMAVLYPVGISIGFDPIWFGIVLIIACELALITPPVAVNLYIIKSLAPESVTINDIALGALPYVLVVWVLFGILIAFPQIVLWLPSMMLQ
jgi:C4-dicarboxylate transporter DctM subunit